MHVQVNGARLFFDVDGAGLLVDGPQMQQRPVLLLLHGAPGLADHSGFKPAFGALADVAQIIYLDLRGCGRSEGGDPGSWTLAQWADDVAAFSATLGLERPIVLGHSGGGFVAMAYGQRHAEQPGGLVLSSTQARFDLDRCLAVFDRLGGEAARSVAAAFFADPTDMTVLMEYVRVCYPLYGRVPADPEAAPRTVINFALWQRFATDWYVTPVGPDLVAGLQAVRCPTLILGGEDDPICPLADQRDIAAALPAGVGRLEVFRGCGHGVWRDEPEQGLNVIREFLCEVGAPSETVGIE